MIRQINKKTILLAGAAFVLTASLSVGSAAAYFTTYATSEGAVPVKMGFTETVPHEEVTNGAKHITITNEGDYDCFVRVKVFSDVEVTYAGNDWEQRNNDGYWYYKPVLAADKTVPTSELTVTITYPDTGDTVKDPLKEFNVIVVQECTPVVYGEDGTPQPDWDHVYSTQAQ